MDERRKLINRRERHVFDHWSKRRTSGREVLVISLHLLGDNAQGYLLLNLREDEGQEEVLEEKDEEEGDRQTDRHFSNESGSLESQYEELLQNALRLRRSNAHSARTALCGAMLAVSGTGMMVSVILKPVPWHQRLDNRRNPLGASLTENLCKSNLSHDGMTVSFFKTLEPCTSVMDE